MSAPDDRWVWSDQDAPVKKPEESVARRPEPSGDVTPPIPVRIPEDVEAAKLATPAVGKPVETKTGAEAPADTAAPVKTAAKPIDPKAVEPKRGEPKGAGAKNPELRAKQPEEAKILQPEPEKQDTPDALRSLMDKAFDPVVWPEDTPVWEAPVDDLFTATLWAEPRREDFPPPAQPVKPDPQMAPAQVSPPKAVTPQQPALTEADADFWNGLPKVAAPALAEKIRPEPAAPPRLEIPARMPEKVPAETVKDQTGMEKAATESKPAVEAKPVAEAKPAVEAKQAVEGKTVKPAEQKRAPVKPPVRSESKAEGKAESKPESKPEGKPVPEKKIAAEAPKPAVKEKRSPLVEAILLHLDGKPAEAVEILLGGLKSGEKPLEIYSALAHLQHELGRLDEAVVSYREVLSRNRQQPGTHYNLGICLERLGRHEQALEAFLEARKVRSNDWESSLGAGVALLHLDRPAEALPLFDHALEVKPNELAPRFGKAAALQQLKRFADAAALYREIVSRQEGSLDALVNLIAVSIESKQPDEARKYAEQAIQVQPACLPAIEALAALEIQAGHYDRAAGLCAKLVEANPESFPGWMNLGIAHLRSKRFDKAAIAFAEASRLRPADTHALLGAAQARLEDGDLPAAKRGYEAVLKIAAGHPLALTNLAILAERTGDTENAERALEKIASLDPKNAETQFRLGYMRLQRGENVGSRAAFQSALQLRSDWHAARLNLGLATWRAGDSQGAEQIFRAAASADLKPVEALYALSQIAIDREDYAAALEACQKLINLGERSAELFYNAGLILQHSGHLEDAALHYQEALTERPGMVEALERLGQVCLGLGQEKEAREYWKQAREGGGQRVERQASRR